MQPKKPQQQRTEEEIVRRRAGWNCLWSMFFIIGLLVFIYFALAFSFSGGIHGIGAIVFYVGGLGILLLLALPLAIGIGKSIKEDR